MRRPLLAALLLLGLAAGCGQEILPWQPDAGPPPDAGEERDGGETDGGETDAGEADGGEPDAGQPDAGEAGTDCEGAPLPPGVRLHSFGPGDTVLGEGTTGPTLPEPLTVTVEGASATSVWVELTAVPSGVVGVADGGVCIPSGASALALELSGLSEGTASLTARVGSQSAQASVRVLSAEATRHLESLTPEGLFLAPGATAGLTVRLDDVVLVDLPLGVRVEPSGALAIGPESTLVVPAGRREATFTVTAPATGRAGTGRSARLTVLLGEEERTSKVSVEHLVISEVSAAGLTDANDEFVELYNPLDAPVSLFGWTLQYQSAASNNPAPYYTFETDHTIPAHGYFLVAGSAYSGGGLYDVRLTSMASAMSGTAGHVLLTYGEQEVDKVAYGAGTVSPEGGEGLHAPAPGKGESIQRKAWHTSTEQTMGAGVDLLRGNGWDSDNNAEDFVQSTTRGPQKSSSPAEPHP